MIIHPDKCAELGLPTPKGYDTQESYITRAIASGFILNTRICRFIGIHNLHSLASIMAKKGLWFSLTHERVLCPFTGEVPPHPVDIIYMTRDQQEAHRQSKLAKA